MTQTVATPTLALERVFNATPERLWEFWTDPKKYAKWIYPGNTDVAMHAFEAKVGGKVAFDMLLDTGEDMPNDGVFHVLDKPRRLEAGSPDRSFLLVATFEPVGTSQTRLRVTVTGVPPEYHEMATQGWNACFDKLGGQLEAPGVSGPPRAVTKDRYVEVTRWYNAPPERVFGAWADAKTLERFFWPVGEGRVKEFAFKPGGRLVMAHATEPWTATWTFTEIVPNLRIGIEDHWDDGSGHKATGVLEFLPENGGTRLKVRHGPFPTSGPYQPEAAAQGFAIVADRLAEETEVPGPGEGFRIVRHFRAPPQKVWDMWTTKAGLDQWWRLSAKDMGFDFRVDRLDVRVGGAYDIVMSNAEHGELHNHGQYLVVEPGKRLVYRWDFDIFLGPGETPYPITVSIELAELPKEAGGGTRMTFTQGAMARPEFTEGSRQGVRANFAKLAKALEA